MLGIRFNSVIDAWVNNGVVVMYLVNYSLVEYLFGLKILVCEFSRGASGISCLD